MKSALISAFPGTGKTFLYNNSNLKILDSDSSKFNKNEFPNNYINHIKNNMHKVDCILISSHKNVREALFANKLPFILVYPDISLKNEYIERYRNRGSSDEFIILLEKNWNTWINELIYQKHCTHCVLKNKEYLSNILYDIIECNNCDNYHIQCCVDCQVYKREQKKK